MAAFQQRQITLRELADAAKPLSSEALNVVATFFNADDSGVENQGRESDVRLARALNRCRSLAAASRVYC